jgi:thiamine pyrophosphate-dependent acetolactate synthase large subunit-like protein
MTSHTLADVVQARHEERSDSEAVGHASYGPRAGIRLATAGHGAVHLPNGLYDGGLDHVELTEITF